MCRRLKLLSIVLGVHNAHRHYAKIIIIIYLSLLSQSPHRVQMQIIFERDEKAIHYVYIFEFFFVLLVRSFVWFASDRCFAIDI